VGGLADLIAGSLKQCRIVMVRGHGSFAIGQLLEEGLNSTTTMEQSSRILFLLKSLKVASAGS
jgi:L-fuculose-phosphate aldolase